MKSSVVKRSIAISWRQLIFPVRQASLSKRQRAMSACEEVGMSEARAFAYRERAAQAHDKAKRARTSRRKPHSFNHWSKTHHPQLTNTLNGVRRGPTRGRPFICLRGVLGSI